MRKIIIIVVALLFLLISTAIAEEWVCPTCGSDANGNYCNNCGTANPTGEWICPQCKEKAKGNFCNNCGSPRPMEIVTNDDAGSQTPTASVEKAFESGTLIDLCPGDYEIGKDLPSGNYEFSLGSGDNSVIYKFANKEKFDIGDGYLYGMYDKDNRVFFYLTDGMYLTIQEGTVQATYTEFSAEGKEFILFSGQYCVGTEIPAGFYEFVQYKENVCRFYICKDKSALKAENYKTFNLKNPSDIECYLLEEDMILIISSGDAAKIVIE